MFSGKISYLPTAAMSLHDTKSRKAWGMLGGVWDSLLPSDPQNSSWGLPLHVKQHGKRKAHAGVGGMPVNTPRFDTHKKNVHCSAVGTLKSPDNVVKHAASPAWLPFLMAGEQAGVILETLESWKDSC